jgi:phosphatidate cytidylyltransferase
VFVVAVTASIFTDPLLFYMLYLCFTVAGIVEFARLARGLDARVNLPSSVTCGVLLFTGGFFHAYAGERYVWIYLLLLLAFTLLPVVELYRKRGVASRNIAYSFHAILYVALPFTLLAYLPYRVVGAWSPGIVILPFLLVWVNDTFAYLFGVAFGRHKLFPRVSPNKSWEGAIGGGVATLATGACIAPFIEGVTRVDTLVIAAIVVPFAIYGDLVESLFKRDAGVKDSGRILPGHGGLLDRLDAVLFAIPVVFVYLEWMY